MQNNVRTGDELFAAMVDAVAVVKVPMDLFEQVIETLKTLNEDLPTKSTTYLLRKLEQLNA